MDLNIENNKKNVIDNSFSKELRNSIEKNILFSIDRFEGNFAVCENQSTNEIVNIERELLPAECKSGDIIKFENGLYILDKETTQEKQEEIKNMVNNLFKKRNS